MESKNECGRDYNEHSDFDGVYFAIRYLQQGAFEVLCLIAEDEHGTLVGAWPQPEKVLAKLD